MEAWHIWILLGIAFLVIEVITAEFLLGTFAVGSFGGSLAAYLGGSLPWQLTGFILVAMIAFFTIRPLLVQQLKRSSDFRGTNVDALMGSTGRVLEEIDGDKGTGQVQIQGQTWRALSIDGEPIAEDSRVEVLDIRGIKLVVRKT